MALGEGSLKKSWGVVLLSPTSVASRHLLPDEESGRRAVVRYRSQITALQPATSAGRRWREATEVGTAVLLDDDSGTHRDALI